MGLWTWTCQPWWSTRGRVPAGDNNQAFITNVYFLWSYHKRAILFEEKMGTKHSRELRVNIFIIDIFVIHLTKNMLNQINPVTVNDFEFDFQDWVARLGPRWRLVQFVISNTTRLYRWAEITWPQPQPGLNLLDTFGTGILHQVTLFKMEKRCFEH